MLIETTKGMNLSNKAIQFQALKVQFQRSEMDPSLKRFKVIISLHYHNYRKARYTLGTCNRIHLFNTSIITFNTNIGVLWTNICKIIQQT